MLVAIKTNPKGYTHIEAELYSRRRDGRNVFALSLNACTVEQRDGWRSVRTELYISPHAAYFIRECGRRTAKQEAAAVAEANKTAGAFAGRVRGGIWARVGRRQPRPAAAVRHGEKLQIGTSARHDPDNLKTMAQAHSLRPVQFKERRQ